MEVEIRQQKLTDFLRERREIRRFSLEPSYDSPHGEEPGSRKEEMHGHL